MVKVVSSSRLDWRKLRDLRDALNVAVIVIETVREPLNDFGRPQAGNQKIAIKWHTEGGVGELERELLSLAAALKVAGGKIGPAIRTLKGALQEVS